MEIAIKKLVANISFLIMRVLDKFFGLFKVYSGLEGVQVGEEGGETVNLITFFMENPVILNAFFYIMIISVGILFFFTVAGIIKSMATSKRTVGKVVAEFGGSVLAFVLVWILFLGIVNVGNVVLVEINNALGGANDVTISQRIIDIAVDDNGWREKNDGQKYSATDFPQNKRMTANEFFGNYTQHKWTRFEKSPGYDIEEDGDGNEIIVYDKDTYDKNSQGMADLYQTDLFMLFALSLILFILVFVTLITLAKRVYDIVYLYLCMPLSVSTIPFDDGARFKLWHDATFSKLFSVYGTVIALNLYLISLSLLDQIHLSSGSETIFRFIFIVGGALSASAGAALFGQLIGATPDQSKNLGQSLYTGMMMAQTGAGIARGIGGLLFGRKKGGGGAGGDGKRHGGLLRTAGKVLDKGGRFLGGNRYVDMKNKISGGYQKLKDTLRGGWMNNGGLTGIPGKVKKDINRTRKAMRRAITGGR